MVHRFVPGESIESALDSAAALRESDRYVSIDYLGEDVTDVDDADGAVQTYLDLIEAVGSLWRSRRWRRPATGGVGEAVGAGAVVERDGEKIARENARSIGPAAQRAGVWVTVDAETHTTTDSTLPLTVRDLLADFPWLGTDFFAGLPGTAQAEAIARNSPLLGPGSGCARAPMTNPRRWPTGTTPRVTDSYLACLRVLMAGSGYAMVASHDPAIISAVPAVARESGRNAADFEYQML